MSNCKKCGKEFTPGRGLKNFCSLSCRNTRIFSEETKNKQSIANIGMHPWNKEKKINWINSNCSYCDKEIYHMKSKPKKYHNECWKKVSGGYRKGSGRGKSGWYKGYWCDSSYELAWIIYQIDHNIKFERNKKEFEYILNGKVRKYIPDFIQNNNFIEIKGYSNLEVNLKLESVPNIQTLFRKDLNKEFEYVERVYGKDFIKLYEGNPYKEDTSTCKLCGDPCKKRNVYCSRRCSGAGNNKNSKLKNN